MTTAFPSRRPVRFATTRWSRIAAASPATPESTGAGLEALVGDYWEPLYGYIRRRGVSREDAEDLTQAFFAFLLTGDRFRQASPERGRFRNFLLAALRNFMANEWRAQQAQKRGGEHSITSLDFDSAERKLTNEPASEETPERTFERRWAMTLMEHALERVRVVYEKSGKVRLFDELKRCLAGGEEDSLAELAEKLEMSPSAIRVAIHRLRKRCRDSLRAEVARTLESNDDLDREIATLVSWLG